MIRVLFVCHGNICRSPMAEYVLKYKATELGLQGEIEVASAATSYEEIGNDIYPPAKETLKQHGIPFTRRQARRMVERDYADYDYLLGMDRYNVQNMKRICGHEDDRKIKRLLDFTDLPRDISDPWYTGDFEQTYRDICEGLEGFLKYLSERGVKDAKKRIGHE